MKRITRDRPLTDEEAAADQAIRDQIAAELPELIAQYLGQKDATKDLLASSAEKPLTDKYICE